MYMLKSMGEFREATMAVRLYGLLLSLCAEITAVICERTDTEVRCISKSLGSIQKAL
jgi:hypothetical protein